MRCQNRRLAFLLRQHGWVVWEDFGELEQRAWAMQMESLSNLNLGQLLPVTQNE